jgi:hypothetical protein
MSRSAKNASAAEPSSSPLPHPASDAHSRNGFPHTCAVAIADVDE